MLLSRRTESRSVSGTKQWKCQDHCEQKHIRSAQSPVHPYCSRAVPGTVGQWEYHHPLGACATSRSSHIITACVVRRSAPIRSTITHRETESCLTSPRSPALRPQTREAQLSMNHENGKNAAAGDGQGHITSGTHTLQLRRGKQQLCHGQQSVLSARLQL